ncbi:MAG: NAD-binding protein [Candidatus Bathyarchaeia archaeon]|jgi:Trk K+ transport system NAD-binding subunit
MTRVLVVGLRRPGIIEKIVEEGAELSVVDADEKLCRQVAKTFKCKVIVGDGTNPDNLKRAGADKAEILVVAMDDDDANLQVCKHARKELGIPQVMVIINDRFRKAEFEAIQPQLDSIIYFIGDKSIRQSG